MLLPHHKSSCHTLRSLRHDDACICVGSDFCWLSQFFCVLSCAVLYRSVSQLYVILFHSSFLVYVQGEARRKNNTERDTFENVYIFTMRHHPKKLRNRKINAKNRAHGMHLYKWAMWLWVCDWTTTFLNKKKCLCDIQDFALDYVYT